jgi:hypothetical protein
MRKFILIVLLLVSPQPSAFASDSPIQNAIDAFLKSQDDKAHPVLNAQISDLMQAGYKKRGSTGAVVLGGECGVVGCTGTYLVTTVYFTPGANTQSTIVAAIVRVGIGGVQVTRILTKAEIERCLINPK